MPGAPHLRPLLVTGAAGLLGSHVGALAVSSGWSVHAVVHRVRPDRPATGTPLDVRDEAAVVALLDHVRPAAVVHCAYRQDDDATTHLGARHVAVAAARVGARLVHLSSDVVLSGAPGRGPLAEDDPPDPSTDYGRAKARAEADVLAACHGALVVRTSLLYRAGGPPADPQTRLALEPGARFFDDELRRPVEVGELAGVLVGLAAPGGPEGVLHLVGADLLDRLAFARLLAAAHGRDPAQLRGGPGPPGRPKELDLARTRAQELGLELRGARQVLADARP